MSIPSSQVPTMAAAEPLLQEPAPVEEIYYRKGDIDFCFLLNRRHHNLRVFDYRVGNYQQKRDFFDRIARSEGLRKVFTVVEKPNLFSVIRHLGVSVLVSARSGTAGPVLHLGGREVATSVLPIDLDVNGSRALCVHVVCAKSEAPGSVVAGIVGAVARHPSEPRSAVLRLLASRRGPVEERVEYAR